MFPPRHRDYYMDRLTLKAELSWEPWLHAAIWLATLSSLIFKPFESAVPPYNPVDWVWVFFGLVSPPIGFFSVWALEHGHGKARYVAIWTRMASDLGLVIAIITYLISRWDEHWVDDLYHVSDVVLLFAGWFCCTLVRRDVEFLLATEKLASILHEREFYDLDGDDETILRDKINTLFDRGGLGGN